MTQSRPFIMALMMIPALSFAAPSSKPSAKKPVAGPSQYFVVQNVATEKTRVYERCVATPDCAHKMVFETDTVVGRAESGTKEDAYAHTTWLGHSQIDYWVKFYSDRKQTYPPWYTAGQDIRTIPTPLSSGNDWRVKSDRGTTLYGAFGWYAAILTPADDVNGVNFQWLHGTVGWGEDERESIERTRGALANLFSNPGSHGCTRLGNLSISYLRSLLKPGTDIYRVYARESTREQEIVSGVFRKRVTPLPRYADKYRNPANWDYILLTDEAQKVNGLEADANVVRASGIAITEGVNLLEQGSFRVDQYPNAVGTNYNYRNTSGKSGDRYGIDRGTNEADSNFRGYFLVDEGRFVDYQHPVDKRGDGKIRVSGMSDFRDSVPEFLKAQGEHYPAPNTPQR